MSTRAICELFLELSRVVPEGTYTKRELAQREEILDLRARLEKALDYIDHLHRNDPMPEDIAKLRGGE